MRVFSVFPDGDSGLRGRREVFSPHVSSPLGRVAGGRLKLFNRSGARFDRGDGGMGDRSIPSVRKGTDKSDI